jgi:protein tyrosine phosphatase
VEISIFGTVRRLREQRWNMVKKQVQYEFIYKHMVRWAALNLGKL